MSTEPEKTNEDIARRIANAIGHIESEESIGLIADALDAAESRGAEAMQLEAVKSVNALSREARDPMMCRALRAAADEIAALPVTPARSRPAPKVD